MSIKQKIWSLERTQSFSKIWPSYLVVDRTWPIFVFVQGSDQVSWLSDRNDPIWGIFELVRDFTKKNILTKFHGNRTENVAS